MEGRSERGRKGRRGGETERQRNGRDRDWICKVDDECDGEEREREGNSGKQTSGDA